MRSSARRARARAGLGALAGVLGSLAACNALLDNADRTLRPIDDDVEGSIRTDAGASDSAEPPEGSPGTDSATPCVGSPQSDPKNCGACGHDCLGGTCNAGTCQPFVFAQATKPQQVFVAGGAVYFSDGTIPGGGINWCPTSACGVATRTPFFTGSYGLAVDGAGIAAANRMDNKVIELPLRFAAQAAGTDCATLATPMGAALDATHLFFTTMNGDVHRCARGVAGSTLVGNGAANGGAVAVDGNNVYWASDGTCAGNTGCLQGVPKGMANQTPNPVGVSLGRTPRTLHVSGNRLFWTATGGAYNGEASWRENGLTGSEFFYQQQLGQPWGITADKDNVYFTMQDGTIRRALRAALINQTVIIATGQNDPRGIAVDSDAIYWVSYGGDAVMKLAK